MIAEVRGVNRLAQRAIFLACALHHPNAQNWFGQISFAARVVGHRRVTDPELPVTALLSGH
jgi:hypothetical protein